MGGRTAGSNVAVGDTTSVGDRATVASAAAGVGEAGEEGTAVVDWVAHAPRTKTVSSPVAAGLAYLIGFPSSGCTLVYCGNMVGETF